MTETKILLHIVMNIISILCEYNEAITHMFDELRKGDELIDWNEHDYWSARRNAARHALDMLCAPWGLDWRDTLRVYKKIKRHVKRNGWDSWVCDWTLYYVKWALFDVFRKAEHAIMDAERAKYKS